MVLHQGPVFVRFSEDVAICADDCYPRAEQPGPALRQVVECGRLCLCDEEGSGDLCQGTSLDQLTLLKVIEGGLADGAREKEREGAHGDEDE